MRNVEIAEIPQTSKRYEYVGDCAKNQICSYLWIHIPSTKNKNYKLDRLLDLLASQIFYLLMVSSMTVILKFKQKCKQNGF